MSKILKRPMFRIGGSANDGIMSMAAPRKNYQGGSEYEQKRDELLPLYQQAMGTGRSERNRLMDLLLEGSLALGAGAGAGKNLPQALALSFREPAQRYIKSGQEEEAAQRQLRLAATTGAISAVDAERLAKMKYGVEMGKEQEQRKKELMQQYQLNYSESNNFQNFLNQANTIGKAIGLPVASAPLFLTFKKGKFEIPGAKNMPEGIYYDPRNNKYIKIHSGTPIIGDTIAEIVKPVVAQQEKVITKEEFPSFDASSP